ncbi:NADH:flavin oxidoreductase [Ponticaulis profundi]|uniref:NADH:flavin oxidoreductase n=1 Tax=Ponticaulis profundi TaxID=2665222 RepID=A0ABW1S7D4_9PROT
MSAFAPLFEPFTFSGLKLDNRIVMAPMTRSFSPDGVPGQDVADYYARRAAADVGLLITEGTTINRKASSFDTRVPNFYGDASLKGWAHVVDEVHKEGGKIAPQIWHVGMMRKEGSGPFPDVKSDSPSGLTHKAKPVYEEPTTEEIEAIIKAFVDGIVTAKELGFDCAEIHGAHGYLVDEFFWHVMNTRSDRFGGSLKARAQFAGEIIAEARKLVGPDYPIILRISQWKQQDYAARLAETPKELEDFLTVFADAGVSCIHYSQRRFWEPEFPEIDGEDGLNFAGWGKKITGLPAITVGSVGLASDFLGSFAGESSKTRPLIDVVNRLDKGEFDLVAVGRALLQDPHWATKVKEGRESELKDYDGAAIKTLF